MTVKLTDVLNAADLPPLADINGTISLDDKNKLPPNLCEVPERILKAIGEGKRVIILNVQPSQDANRNSYQAFPRENTDVYQFACRGLANDPRFKDFLVISPDDRDSKYNNNNYHDYGSKEVYKALAEKVIDMEEEGCDEGQVMPRFCGKSEEMAKITGDNRKGLIIVFTPQILAELSGAGSRLQSKVGRLFGLDKATTIDIQPSGQNMYEAWDKYAVEAKVDEIRRLLIAAASEPVSMGGVIPKANKPGPKFQKQDEQEGSEKAVLQMLQRGLYLPGAYVIHGDPGRGKTTWMLAMRQLCLQTGYTTYLDRWKGGTNSLDSFPIAHDQWKERVLRELVSEDGKLRDGKVNFAYPEGFIFVDQAEFGNNKVMEGGKAVFPQMGSTIVMTMNRNPADLFKYTANQVLSFLTCRKDSVSNWSDVGKRKPCLTYVDITNQPVLAAKLEGRDWAEVITK